VAPDLATRQEWAERAGAKIAAAQETLATEVAALRSGEDWRRFLDFQARLHCYSPNNVMLIAAQHATAFAEGRVASPEPTYVGGFNTWRTLGRSVDRGQHGYAVLAPCRYDRRVAVNAEGHARPLAKVDTPVEGESVENHRVLAGFRVEHVFDVSQTSGAELPEPPRPVLLEGEAPAGLGAAVLALIEDRGFRVDTVPDAGAIQGANGQTNWGSRTVLVRADMDDAAMVKTLVHEAAHVILHERPPGQYLPRATKEVEAESVAYVVAATHGMATDGYSFPYVAGWAGEDGAKAVVATQARVAKAARQIIEASPAPHVSGGRVPGADTAIAAARSRREELEGRLSPTATESVATEPAGVGL
jgi:hypothetical protein